MVGMIPPSPPVPPRPPTPPYPPPASYDIKNVGKNRRYSLIYLNLALNFTERDVQVRY